MRSHQSRYAFHPSRPYDDVAAFPMSADVGEERLEAVNYAHDVDVEHPSPTIERNVLNPAAAPHSGIVAQEVDASELRKRDCRSTFDTLRVCYVAEDALDLGSTTQTRYCSFQCGALDICQHHPSACAAECAAKRKPNPARTSCDECSFPSDVTHDR